MADAKRTILKSDTTVRDYGEETDIYKGLWDGSRLLATVEANAGFGSIGGGSIGGNRGVEPGGPFEWQSL